MNRTSAQQWEYTVIRPPRDETKKEAENPEAALNEHGKDGWELAETITYTDGGTKYLVFKRPVDTTADTSEGDAT